MRPASGPLRKYPVTPTAQHAVMDTKIPGNLRDLLAALLDQPHGLQLELTSELLSLRRHETPPGGKLPRAWSGVHEAQGGPIDRKSTRLNSSHVAISYAVFCLKKKISY